MANKRLLKKQLNETGSELFAECVAAYFDVHDEDLQQVDDILSTVLKTHNDFVKRVSFPEPGLSKKVYYKTLRDDFKKQADEIRNNIKALA